MARLNLGRKTGFIQRGGAMRRETIWFDVPRTAATLAASATAALVATLGAPALALRPFTIVRTRGQLWVRSDQSAATEVFIGSLGFAVVSDQAAAIGVSAVPTPATDLGSDLWFVHEAVMGQFALIGTSVTQIVESRPFDSKAMRKVEDGQDVAQVVEAGIGGNGCIIESMGRLLVKLH